MATAREVICRLSARGVTLKADGTGGLRVCGISRLSAAERNTLRKHKSAILKALADGLDNPATTTSPTSVAGPTTAVASPVRQCQYCCHWQQYPYEVPLGSCHACKRMQHASSRPMQFGCSHFKPAAGQQKS